MELFELKYLKKKHQPKNDLKNDIDQKQVNDYDEDYAHLDAKLGIKNLDQNYPEFTFQDVPKKEIVKQTFEEYFKDFMKRKQQEMDDLEENIASHSNLKYDAACNLELIETVPSALRKNGYADKMPVEHKSTFDVSI